MFDNIGRKIKILAEAVCWFGIIASLLAGACLIVNDRDTAAVGLLVLVLGPLFSWIGSFMTYGFGQLVENSDILVENSEILVEKSVSLIENSDILVADKTKMRQ